MNIPSMKNDKRIDFQTSRTLSQIPKGSNEKQQREDVYTSSKNNNIFLAGNENTSSKSSEMTDKMIRDFASRYNVRNMTAGEFRGLLTEFRNNGLISDQEFSAGYAGLVPSNPATEKGCWTINEGGMTNRPGGTLSDWPKGDERVDFLSVMQSYGTYCKQYVTDAKREMSDSEVSMGNNYSNYYSRLQEMLQKIENAEQLL